MSTRPTRWIVALAAVSALAIGGTAPAAFARHGADDPVGHNAGDDHGGKRVNVRSVRRGADDGAAHHRRHGRHGADDGPNHT